MKTKLKIERCGGWKTVLAVALAGLALGAVAWADEGEVLKATFSCAEPVYDFGSALSTAAVTHSYVFKNTGKLTLTISGARASCGCTVAKVAKDTIPPGEEGTIDVTFNLVGRLGYQLKTITVTCNDPDQPNPVLTLKGTVIKPVWASPAALYMGRIATPEARQATFSVESDQPMTVKSWWTTGASATVEYLGAADGMESRRHDFRLTVEAPGAEGPFNGDVRVETDDVRQPEVVIPYTGYWAIPAGAGAGSQE